MDEIQSVTIFRSWVELAATLSDSARGKLYQAICEYALDGREPQLPKGLGAFFTIIKPSIDKSQKRKVAQMSGAKKRSQNDLQTDLQKRSQNDLQTDLQTATARARKTGTGTEKKKEDTNVSSKEKDTKHVTKKPRNFSILLPDHLQNSLVCEKWEEWEDYRRKRGKAISEAAARKQMKMLAELTQEEAIATIDQSIANDYQGLFPPRRGAVPPKQPGRDYSGI